MALTHGLKRFQVVVYVLHISIQITTWLCQDIKDFLSCTHLSEHGDSSDNFLKLF